MKNLKKIFCILVVISFYIQVLSAQVQVDENLPLFFGNPSKAAADISLSDNYLVEKEEFTLSYNNSNLIPNWVAWHLCSADLGEASRGNKFRADSTLPENWYKVIPQDYQFAAYGFDRGHVCPSADRTSNQKANDNTFLMTNMIPQAPDCNRIVWMHLENFERELVFQGNEVYIFAGGAGTGGEGNRGIFEEIHTATKNEKYYKIKVPQWCWKIILILPEGEKDFQRVLQNDVKILSVCIPNKQGCNKDENGNKIDWKNYLVTVDFIEELTGFDFFDLLPDEIENKIEKEVWTYE